MHFIISATTYNVSIKTGDVRGAGTDAEVFLKIFGSNQSTSELPLRNAEHTKNKFERNRTDTFKLQAADIGKVRKNFL